MYDAYEDCLGELEQFATKDGISEFRVARETFHSITGQFEDGEPWFEIRMKMFMDWFLLDREGPSGATPLEVYLLEVGHTLSTHIFEKMVHLTSTLRSAFKIESIAGETLLLSDMLRGGQWEATATSPAAGLESEDLIDARIAYFNNRLIMCPGTVLHPRQAHKQIFEIIERAKTEGMPPRETVDHLDKMKLKLDRYSNVRIQHIYRYPGETRL